jgi:D-tyrosyl-tRNA(Tyr) deacylase
MRAVVQRVSEASVRVGHEIVGRIGPGLLVLLGVARTDGEREAGYLAEKVVHLRVFEDETGKLNRSVLERGGELLVVSQFTLLGDCRKGRRPSFGEAADPDQGRRLYEHFIAESARRGVAVRTGRFRALMQVSLVNDGPVTLVIDTPQTSL